MKKYILPILTFAVLAMTSCNEDTVAEAVENTTETVKTTTTDAIQTTTETVQEIATEITTNTNEQVENITKESIPTTQAVTATTTMKVDRLVHDFGTINDDLPVSTTFTVTNTGNKPLIITQAKGSCGCTVPTYPKTPIAPGKSGTIEVTFSPKGKAGAQNKTVTLIANTTPASTVMNIKSVVNKIAK